ncbi:MAG: GNAT family N-acetyltransferase [Novosphingobium sp.]|jgi:predicted N-acetyltransferase YhbS
MIIRDECPSDVAVIYDVTKAAFATMPFSDGDEPELVDKLRAAKALTLSLVAEEDGEVLGHIAFSPVSIAGAQGDWYGLGPVSVRPDRQRQGIGAALIRAGLARLEAIGAAGCILLGHRDYYPRFGFAHDPGLTFAGQVNLALQQLTLRGPTPQGDVIYHPAFY